MGGEYLYVMDDSPYGRKIGISNDPENRLKQIKSHNPRDIEVIYKYECDERSHALSLEKKLHKKFNKKNIRNEWFKIDDVDLEEIKKVCESFYKDYQVYDSLESWFEEANEKELLNEYYAPFVMPKIKKIDAMNQNIIFEEETWNDIFQKHFGLEAKRSLNYLQKKLDILNSKKRNWSGNDVVSLHESSFYFCAEQGLKWDKKLEQYLHFFGAYDRYHRKDGFELLNIWNHDKDIPFFCNASNEKWHGDNFMVATHEDYGVYGDMIYYDFIENKKIRILGGLYLNYCLLQNYMNKFYGKKIRVGFSCWNINHTKDKSNPVSLGYYDFEHYISGKDKFCTDRMSQLHKEFLIDGFKKIYDIDFIEIMERLNIYDEIMKHSIQ